MPLAATVANLPHPTSQLAIPYCAARMEALAIFDAQQFKQ